MLDNLLAAIDARSAYALPVLATAAAPFAGAVLTGLDRKLTARMQGRIGPPVMQPFYDTIKLFRKAPMAVNRVQLIYAWLHLALMMLTVTLLALGQDMLMILFVHAFSTIALILGGMCVHSPYSSIGAQRTIMQMLAYEPILVLLVVGIYLSHNTFSIAQIHGGVPLLVSLPLVFLAFQAVVAIKLQNSPFDVATSHHAHQEIVKGITTEYSGPYLALLELTHFYEVAALFGVIACFWGANLYVGVALAAVCFVAQIILDNVMARLTTMWMLRWMWTAPMMLAVSNVIWLYLKNGNAHG